MIGLLHVVLGLGLAVGMGISIIEENRNFSMLFFGMILIDAVIQVDVVMRMTE